MGYIKDLHEGETIRNVYLCKGKRSAETRNGKPYDNLILQDKTCLLYTSTSRKQRYPIQQMDRECLFYFRNEA